MTRLFVSVMAALCLLFASSSADAEQKLQVGGYDIHYVALPSTFLTPRIAKAYGIKRSSYMGLINISILNTELEGSPAISAEVTGIANNLLDAKSQLKFREIREGSAIYYIAEIGYRDDQEINFKINIKHGSELNTQLTFKQKFYVE